MKNKRLEKHCTESIREKIKHTLKIPKASNVQRKATKTEKLKTRQSEI
jgi:hypothetical protein